MRYIWRITKLAMCNFLLFSFCKDHYHYFEQTNQFYTSETFKDCDEFYFLNLFFLSLPFLVHSAGLLWGTECWWQFGSSHSSGRNSSAQLQQSPRVCGGRAELQAAGNEPTGGITYTHWHIELPGSPCLNQMDYLLYNIFFPFLLQNGI